MIERWIELGWPWIGLIVGALLAGLAVWKIGGAGEPRCRSSRRHRPPPPPGMI